MLEKMSQGQNKWEREKTLRMVIEKRVLLLLEKAQKSLVLKMKKTSKIKWLLCWRRSMISHALLNSRKMISNHIQMLNHSSTSSLMMSRLKFWKWNEIFEIDLIKFKVAKSRLKNQEIALNLQTVPVIKNEFKKTQFFDSLIHPKIPVASALK